MTIGEHLDALYRLPSFTFPGPDAPADRLPEPESVAWRIGANVYDTDEAWTDTFARFRADVDTARVRALIIGGWEEEAYDTAPTPIVEALVEARDAFPHCARCSWATW